MKFNQFNGCKTLTTIIFLLVLLIIFHNLFKTFINLNQQLNEINSTSTSEENSEHDVTTVRRIKRFLIFQGGGVVKLVLGISLPIMMVDKKRSLNDFYNFQMQYAPPTIPLYWWSLYNTTTFAARKRSTENLMHLDKSRSLVYEFIEGILKRSGNSNSECLLNVICELARTPFFERAEQNFEDREGNEFEGDNEDDCGREIFHKIINAIFAPNHSNIEERYLNARRLGQNGANCNKSFGKCAIAEKIFKKFTRFA